VREAGFQIQQERSLSGWLEWLLRISFRKIDNMVIHHLPIFLWQAVLNHGSNREICLKLRSCIPDASLNLHREILKKLQPHQ